MPAASSVSITNTASDKIPAGVTNAQVAFLDLYRKLDAMLVQISDIAANLTALEARVAALESPPAPAARPLDSEESALDSQGALNQ